MPIPNQFCTDRCQQHVRMQMCSLPWGLGHEKSERRTSSLPRALGHVTLFHNYNPVRNLSIVFLSPELRALLLGKCLGCGVGCRLCRFWGSGFWRFWFLGRGGLCRWFCVEFGPGWGSRWKHICKEPQLPCCNCARILYWCPSQPPLPPTICVLSLCQKWGGSVNPKALRAPCVKRVAMTADCCTKKSVY